MGDLSPVELLTAAREAGGEEALKNLAPIALEISMADGYEADSPAIWHNRSVVVSPKVNPILDAHMLAAEATPRGASTYQVGLGEDSPTWAIGRMLDVLPPGVAWPKERLEAAKGPRDLSGTRTTPGTFEHIRQAADNARWEFTQARINRHAHNEYRGALLGNPARFGVVSFSGNHRAVYMSVHTTQFLVLPQDLQDEIGHVELNLWQAGKDKKNPVALMPSQALAVMEWAASEGLPIVDSLGTSGLAKLRQRAARSVVAWTRRGRPAQATVAVGTKVAPEVRAALAIPDVDHGSRSSRIVNTDAVALATHLGTMPKSKLLLHPAVADMAALAGAAEVSDDRLRDYQREAVGRHTATDVGYVNACSPGMGKTVMVLDGMRRRAARIPSYRGLVVVEANVRHQWVGEAAAWFPEAVVVEVTSRADTSKLQAVLEGAGTFPVLVVTSYTLASDVLDVGEFTEVDSDTADDAGQDAGPEMQAVSDAIADDFTDLLGYLTYLEAQHVEDVPPLAEQDATTRPLGSLLREQRWHDLAADEAACLKTRSSQQSKALWSLREKAQVAIAMTGTPIDKSLNDLGALVSWVRNDMDMFYGAQPETLFDLADDDSLEDFAQAFGPVLFRRDKSEIADELPGVETEVMVLEPTAPELALANAARGELKRSYEELSHWIQVLEDQDPDDPEIATVKAALTAARHAWLGGTTLARQASSDPAALLSATSAGAALLASQGLIEAATQTVGTKRVAVVADTVARVTRGERVLIFTEFATVAKGLIADLDAAGLRVGEVLGGGGKKRDRHIDSFRRGQLDVLVCTSAGERGLNLQTATTLIHYDLPWTPSAVIQRNGRVERIGAGETPIKIVFPIMAGTIEERVVAIVVSRAAKAMRALDASRGVDVTDSDMGRALGGLVGVVNADEVNSKDSALFEMTRELLAA